MKSKEEEQIRQIARFFDGEVLQTAPQTDFFSTPLSEEKKILLRRFSVLRYFKQIAKLAEDWGINEEFFLRAESALKEVSSFLPFNSRQIVLFVFLYLCSEMEGSDIKVSDIADTFNMTEKRLLETMDWQQLEKWGFLMSHFAAQKRTFRLPQRVMKAVAIVDMAFYLNVLKNRNYTGKSEEKMALFLIIALEMTKKNESRNYFTC